jgi:hypothetical protein
MTRQLRECPWCRSPGDLLGVGVEPFDGRFVAAVECARCGACGPEAVAPSTERARQKARDAWGYA